MSSGKRFFAGRDAERAFQLRDHAEHGLGGGVRSEVERAVGDALAGHRDARPSGFDVDVDVRVGLRVLQADVVFRRVLLDEAVFQRQRFHFGTAGDEAEIVHGCCHFRGFGVVRTVEILRHTVAQGTGFSDVNDIARLIFHDVDARNTRKCGGF